MAIKVVTKLAELKGNDVIIAEAHNDGRLLDALRGWETKDLDELRKEILRDHLIETITGVKTDDIVKALKRLGWTDSVVSDIEDMEREDEKETCMGARREP